MTDSHRACDKSIGVQHFLIALKLPAHLAVTPMDLLRSEPWLQACQALGLLLPDSATAAAAEPPDVCPDFTALAGLLLKRFSLAALTGAASSSNSGFQVRDVHGAVAIPRLLVEIASVTPPAGGGAGFAVLRDASGAAQAVLDAAVWDEQGPLSIVPGAVLLLRDVTLYSPGPGLDVLNVLPDCVVAVWPPPAA